MILSGIFALAVGVLPTQQATLCRWQGRETNPIGLEVDTYSPGEPLVGSIQPVDRSRYAYMGLDTSKGYATIYTATPLHGAAPGRNPDVVLWQGHRWEVLGGADWQTPAGFTGAMAMDTGPAPEPLATGGQG